MQYVVVVFPEEYDNLTYGGNYGGKEYAAYGYDSVWVIAYALNQTANTLENRSRTSLLDLSMW
jgi:ABC-type branched-subunit amino acid transport system substrate-binding protein